MKQNQNDIYFFNSMSIADFNNRFKDKRFLEILELSLPKNCNSFTQSVLRYLLAVSFSYPLVSLPIKIDFIFNFLSAEFNQLKKSNLATIPKSFRQVKKVPTKENEILSSLQWLAEKNVIHWDETNYTYQLHPSILCLTQEDLPCEPHEYTSPVTEHVHKSEPSTNNNLEKSTLPDTSNSPTTITFIDLTCNETPLTPSSSPEPNSFPPPRNNEVIKNSYAVRHWIPLNQEPKNKTSATKRTSVAVVELEVEGDDASQSMNKKIKTVGFKYGDESLVKSPSKPTSDYEVISIATSKTNS